jgi:flagellar export protein FliJ
LGGERNLKRFRFPLEKALEVRELERLVSEQKLGAFLRELANTETRIGQVESLLDFSSHTLKDSVQGYIDPARVRDILRFNTSLRTERTGLQRDLARHKENSNKAREEVVQRMMDEETLKNYKTRLKKAYNKVYWWQQGKVLDEVSSTRYAKMKGGDLP